MLRASSSACSHGCAVGGCDDWTVRSQRWRGGGVADRRDERWAAMFAALERFYVRFGHANVPRSFRTDEGERLGAWLHRQRSLFAAGTLPAERMQLLERVGVRWSVADRSAGIAAFAAFRSAAGHGLVPHTFLTEDGFPLGTWVQSRRRQWSRNAADAERLWPELVALDFVWVVRDDAAAWAAGVTALDQYRRDHGDVLVPHWFVTADGLQLGRWVDSRRVEYRNGALPADRARVLELLGMVWRLRQSPDDRARRSREDAHFEQMLQHVHWWVSAHESCLPTARDITDDGVAIGRWVLRQRRLHRDGQLSPERVARFDNVRPGWAG